ncbi:hypothetical protein EHS25_002705 [Saitozyma podzolica]|uniref:CID domain-containing protein n=1 Tax=Saitozyma podzolica TaxID=1890683 RepID=A0A427YDB1_9TREE|nr:hypothetical protein EHS25_002705 [Saitozyma podzolica]
MSFDPFETRLHFLQLLRKLNASQLSIQKVVGYAVKYGSRCGEDLWECITEECAKGSLNTRINILYFLDSLAEASTSLGPQDAPYLDFISRDLGLIVERVVPDTREGVLNLKSAKQRGGGQRAESRRKYVGNRAALECAENEASGDNLAPVAGARALQARRREAKGARKRKRQYTWHRTALGWALLIRWTLQILESWRTRRIIPPEIIDSALAKLDSPRDGTSPKKRGREETFSRNDILRRMEEDRERHKRLRERIWILPIPSLPGQSRPPLLSHTSQPAQLSQHSQPSQSAQSAQSAQASPSSSASPFNPASPSSRKPGPPAPGASGGGGGETGMSALDVEFEQMWENTSELDEEDLDKMREDTHIAGLEAAGAT